MMTRKTRPAVKKIQPVEPVKPVEVELAEAELVPAPIVSRASDVLWRRLRYMLSPQWDLYAKLAPHLKGCSVLEIGFGTGFGTVQLAACANKILAADVDAEAVKFAESAFPLANVTWWLGDVLQIKANQYDAVVMIEVLEHVADYHAALQNMHHVLKPGGKLYISARNANADLRRNDLHQREWTAGEFHTALSEFFAVVELYDYTLTAWQNFDTHVTPLVAVAFR